jgi:ATP-dependent helicase/nuclease subunit B
VAACANPEAEVILAAREIRRHVRHGGRYREATVLVRRLEGYHERFQRIFARYDIPFFLDRRESVSHHPLAELTRSALRTVAFQWRRDDWFAALKTGLVPADEADIDRLENEALARGWQGSVWQTPIFIANQPELNAWLEAMLPRILPPFQRLALAMATRHQKPSGPQLAEALRALWQDLAVEAHLQAWAAHQSSSSDFRVPSSVHETVWSQMNEWLENVELAFPGESLTLREWLPIVEAGLANLSVGVVPPALDQVLVGAIDRSRNPEIKLALVLGLNETIFPAPPEGTALLTELDRVELEQRGVALGATARQQLNRERFYAYLACTRARERLVLTRALEDGNGSPLNPSPFLAQLQQLFPSLHCETVPNTLDWRESEHVNELIVPLLKARALDTTAKGIAASAQDAQAKVREFDVDAESPVSSLAALPALRSVLEQLQQFQAPQLEEILAPGVATRLYGSTLSTSVSRMEQFAACPFKYFVHSGMRAEERSLFELDVREQGSFQHDVLAFFHEELRREDKRWRDITPTEARQRVARIAQGLIASYRDGLLQASEQSRFTARVLTGALQDFVETLVGWMQQQYLFDPTKVELPFGVDAGSPPWRLQSNGGHRLELYGRIDRIDLYREPGSDEALCVVVDYKSSQKQLDPVLLEHGLQLQLLTYLSVLRHWPNPRDLFGVDRLLPAGVFYVNLRGKYGFEQNRRAALERTQEARQRAYRHTGRFNACVLPLLDARPDASEGDQFNYRLTKAGEIHKACREPMETAEFVALLESLENHLKRMGDEIFSGQAKVSPYRKGSTTACDQCSYQSICRIDPWTHRFRVLRKMKAEAGAD